MLVCVSVCVSHLRSREQDVIAPRFLHRREELCLASCTNCFSSRYNAPLERKRLWKFFRGYALMALYHIKTSGYDLAYEIVEGLALSDMPFMCQNLPTHELATRQNLPVCERVSSSIYIYIHT